MSYTLLFQILWIFLIVLDLILAKKLYSLFRKDKDLRKLMFIIGLLMCTPIYASAIIGTNFSPLVGNIFEWSALPILLAFMITLLNDRYNLDLKKCFKFFIIVTAVTFSFFFLAPRDAAMPFLVGGVIFAITLGVVQYSRRFDLTSVTLFLSMPIFSVCLSAIYLNLTETALTAGFAAKAVLFLAFEIPKNQVTQSSSIVVLRKQLTVAEENFAKLFNMLPDPAVIVDGKGTFIALTESVSKLSGFQKEELLGTNFMASHLITASSKAKLLKNLAKRMMGFHIDPYEIELLHKNGKLMMQFELNAMKIEYEGKPADMVVFRDLTERKRLIKSIEEEQIRFQSVAENTGDWIWEVDSEGNYTYSNPVVEKILGYTAEEIIGRKCCALLCEDDCDQKEHANELFSSKNRFVFTKRCQHKNGNVTILESQGIPLIGEDGKFLGYRGVDRDITQRRLAEEEISNSKKYLENLLDSMLSAIVVLDEKTHKIIDVNKEALNMMGRSREEVLGKECHQFMCPTEKGKCPVTDLGLKIHRSEKILLSANGCRVPIIKSISRITSGEQILLVENFIDISERKRMEEKVVKSERLAAIGSLATMVAHDLRNPLQSVSTAVYYIRKATQNFSDQKIPLVLQRIDDSIKYSEKIVRDLLDFSGEIKLELSETDFKSFVNEVLSRIEIPSRVKVVDNTQDNPKIFLDLDRFRRVVVNLVSNACEAMPNGGTLNIDSKEVEDWVELSFKDTGLGIIKDKMDKLWIPFVTTKARGMGLGLPICKRIIEAHGGQIIVESEKDKGTTFRLLIPKVSPEKREIEFYVKKTGDIVNDREEVQPIFDNGKVKLN